MDRKRKIAKNQLDISITSLLQRKNIYKFLQKIEKN